MLLVGLALAGCADIAVHGVAEAYKSVKKSTALMNDEAICLNATGKGTSWLRDPASQKYVFEAKQRGLTCGVAGSL